MLRVGDSSEVVTVDNEEAYLKDVLGLSDGMTEDQMDMKLHEEAKELGIDVDRLNILPPKPLSTRTFSSEARRSESIDSRASQSTGITSTFSVLSNEQRRSPSRRASRASLSFRDYDNFLARGTPSGRNSISFSPSSTPAHSAFSLPLSSPSSSAKKHFLRIRGLSMLKLNRTESQRMGGCPHCPQDLLSQRRAIHKVPCGHRLCTQALRDTIRAATATRAGGVPSCCGSPISGSLLQTVMTKDEQRTLLERLDEWDEAASAALPTSTGTKSPISDKRPDFSPRTASSDSKVDSMIPQSRLDFSHIQDHPDAKRLQKEHNELLERLVLWAEVQRVELKTRHESLRAQMKILHESATEDLLEHHANAMAEAEDKQVKAESDMRETHTQERRDNATALKHMEAYCAGTLHSTGEAHHRSITDQDFTELEKTRRLRDGMDMKHESAINVLRGEQSRRMKLRAQRQDKELQELRRAQRKEELDFERGCTAEVHRLDEVVSEKQKKMRARHELQLAIVAKRLEARESEPVPTLFANVNWQAGENSGTVGPNTLEIAIPTKPGISTALAVSGQV